MLLRRPHLATRLCANCLRRRLLSSTTRVLAEDSTSPQRRKVIFSGIQPTGVPHLGNYLGALRQWVKLQNESPQDDTALLFSIVDLHAITVKQDPSKLSVWRKEMLASLLAIGLEPSKSHIFCQSSVPQHAELMWILSCTASMGYLGRMTQWKSKMSLPESTSPFETAPDPKSREAVKLGLFSYPVLQAADVLLYGTTHVPVGEDQAQHLEFTRQLAIGFNHNFSSTEAARNHRMEPLLIPPETILSPAKRVMSLTNPEKKMSKSDADPRSRILITDSKEELKKKIMGALTDSTPGISYNRKDRPGVSNLIDLMYYMDESVAASPEDLAADMKDVSMRAFKEKVAATLDTNIRDVRDRYEDFVHRGNFLAAQNEEAARRVRELADKRLDRIKSIMGLGWLY